MKLRKCLPWISIKMKRDYDWMYLIAIFLVASRSTRASERKTKSNITEKKNIQFQVNFPLGKNRTRHTRLCIAFCFSCFRILAFEIPSLCDLMRKRQLILCLFTWKCRQSKNQEKVCTFSLPQHVRCTVTAGYLNRLFNKKLQHFSQSKATKRTNEK